MALKNAVVEVTVKMKIDTGELNRSKVNLIHLANDAADQDQSDRIESALGVLDAVTDAVYEQHPELGYDPEE